VVFYWYSTTKFCLSSLATLDTFVLLATKATAAAQLRCHLGKWLTALDAVVLFATETTAVATVMLLLKKHIICVIYCWLMFLVSCDKVL